MLIIVTLTNYVFAMRIQSSFIFGKNEKMDGFLDKNVI